MLKRLWKTQRGFTLVELMIVATIIGILAAIAAPNYQWGIIRAKEAVLREDLYSLRSTIDQFYADQGKYPDSLVEMADKKYLRQVPKDPFTKESEWDVTPPPAGGDGQEVKGAVYDVHSKSDLIGSNGVPYRDW